MIRLTFGAVTLIGSALFALLPLKPEVSPFDDPEVLALVAQDEPEETEDAKRGEESGEAPANKDSEAVENAEEQTESIEPVITAPPYRRVPRYFGRIGLTPRQKEQIYVIRGGYRARIAELERTIERLRQEEMEHCESVLTETQRELLQQMRAASQPRSIGTPPKPKDDPDDDR